MDDGGTFKGAGGLETDPMRPIYETDADRDREAQVARWIESRWPGVALVPAPPRDVIDYFAIRREAGVDEVRAFIEIKCRNCRVAEFPTFLFPYGKYRQGVFLSHPDAPFMIVVRWLDAIGTLKSPDPLLRPVYHGRRDRGDPQDMGAHVMIPIERFTLHEAPAVNLAPEPA